MLAMLAGASLLFRQELLAVCDRQPVVVGMNLAEGKKTVAVATILDEGRLEGRLYPGELGELEVAIDLGLCGGFVFELLNS